MDTFISIIIIMTYRNICCDQLSFHLRFYFAHFCFLRHDVQFQDIRGCHYGGKNILVRLSFRIVAAEQLGKLKNGTSKRDFKNEIPTIGEKATLSLTISSLFPHLKLRGFPAIWERRKDRLRNGMQERPRASSERRVNKVGRWKQKQ